MAKITVDEDSALQWLVVSDDATYGLTLDLPDGTVEWIRRVASDWEEIQGVLRDLTERHYAQREAERQARTV